MGNIVNPKKVHTGNTSGMHIAIIDDGINEALYNLGPLEFNLEITPDLEVRERAEYNPYVPGHGTICGAIIKKYYPGAQLSSIKILNAEARGNCQQLQKAIEWCIEHNILLVNLSLGTIDYRDFPVMRKVINRAYRSGLVMIAACNNADIFTYPASLSTVIGVKVDKSEMLPQGEYIFHAYALDGIEVTACGKHSLKTCDGDEMDFEPANSFAAPMITALVAQMMEKDSSITLEQVKVELRKRASNRSVLLKATVNCVQSRHTPEYNPYISQDISWAEKAIFFNIGLRHSAFSEIDNSAAENYLFNCPDQEDLSFQASILNIEKVETVNITSGSKALEEIISYLNMHAEVLELADTFVITDNSCHDNLDNIDIEKILKLAGELGKGLIVIDVKTSDLDLSLSQLTSRIQAKFWHSACAKWFGPGERFEIQNGLAEIPLIMIYGSSTAEILLAYIVSFLATQFRQNGYHAIAVANTPSVILTGGEYIPFSEKSAQVVDGLHKLQFLGQIYRPDILIAGNVGRNNQMEQIKSIDQYMPVDIKIIIVDKMTSSVFHEIELSTNNRDNVEVIGILSPGTPDLSTNLRIFTFDRKSLPQLYKYIVRLFESST